jgi:hypothetical protein
MFVVPSSPYINSAFPAALKTKLSIIVGGSPWAKAGPARIKETQRAKSKLKFDMCINLWARDFTTVPFCARPARGCTNGGGAAGDQPTEQSTSPIPVDIGSSNPAPKEIRAATLREVVLW